MKKFKSLCIALAIVSGIQCSTAFAAGTTASFDNGIAVTSVQPRGRYLQDGECSITPYDGYVKVYGITKAYDPVDEITVELALYKEVSPGSWSCIWSDSKTAYNTSSVKYPTTTVYVERGYNFKVVSNHIVTENGTTESSPLETNKVYVAAN